MQKYGEGIYRIVRENGGWSVAKKNASDDRWHRVSNLYRFRGWAQAYARRMKLNVVNYAGLYS